MLLCLLAVARCIIVHPDATTLMGMFQDAKLKPVVLMFTDDRDPTKGRAESVWAKVMAKYERHQKVIVGDFSCSNNRQFCIDIGVQRVPMIRCNFGPDIVIPFDDMLKTEVVVDWIEKMMQSPIVNSTEFGPNHVIFALSGTSYYHSYRKTAFAYKNTSNLFTLSNTSGNSLTAFYSDNFTVSMKINDEEDIVKFVWKHQFPLVGELKFADYSVKRRNRRFMAIVIFDILDREQLRHFDETIDQLRNTAKQFHSNFTISWSNSETLKTQLDTYRITKFPSILVLDSLASENDFYLTESFDDVDDWFRAIENGDEQRKTVSTSRKARLLAQAIWKRYAVIVVVVASLFGFLAVLFVIFVREYKLLSVQKKRLYRMLKDD